jgi:hypothetical protein
MAAAQSEDAADYQAFESAITADYDVHSAVERELVLSNCARPAEARSLSIALCHHDFKRNICAMTSKLSGSSGILKVWPAGTAALNGGMKSGRLTGRFATMLAVHGKRAARHLCPPALSFGFDCGSLPKPSIDH